MAADRRPAGFDGSGSPDFWQSKFCVLDCACGGIVVPSKEGGREIIPIRAFSSGVRPNFRFQRLYIGRTSVGNRFSFVWC